MQDCRERAFRYFDGKASPDDERELYLFINSSPEARRLWEEWEAQWAANAMAQPSSEEWLRFERKLRIREAMDADSRSESSMRSEEWGVRSENSIGKDEEGRDIPHSSLLTPHSSLKRFPLRKLAAAVALLAVVGAGLYAYMSRTDQPAQTFVSEAPEGERSRILLPDGTSVLLNAGSRLAYSSQFGREDMTVELTGEAFFEVARHDAKQPFTVRTRSYDVKVTGTKFDVAAYADDSLVTTTLFEGHVDVVYKGLTYKMEPGEEFKVNVNSGRPSQQKMKSAYTQAWTENRIEYENITLEALANVLSRQYGCKVVVEGAALGEQRLNISLRNNETLAEVLSAISRLTGARVKEQSQEKVILY